MVYGAVPPLILTVAVEPFTTVTGFGVAIMLATVTGTLTVDVPALSLTTMVAVPAARPVTESVVPATVARTFVESEFDFTEYGTLPPDIVTDAVPPTSNETDVGVAVNPPVVSPGPAGLLSDLLQLVTNIIALATITVNTTVRDFFMIMMTQ
jgi:hypothetical protein